MPVEASGKLTSLQPPPEHLCELASEAFTQACQHLLNYDMLTTGELPLLYLYADLWHEYAIATEEMGRGEEGRFIAGRGRPFLAAAAQYRMQVLEKILKIARDFGMSPASRASLRGGEALDEDDPLDIVMAGEKT